MDNRPNHASRLDPMRRLKIALALVLAIMIAEVIGGLVSNSLALLSDAGHMLVDALALGLSLFAMTIAMRPATPTKTYGYHRIEIMAALANGTVLIVLALWIFYEAYQRFLTPSPVQTPLMLLVAAVGLVANLIGLLLLREASHHHLNVKSAFWHILGDTISSVGVIIAAIIISVTQWYIVDSIIAIFIGVIILWGAVRIVRESVDILLEAVPKHIDINKTIEAIKSVPGVEDVHDIHIWTITSDRHALSAHLVINDQTVSRSAEIVGAVNQGLARDFDMWHTTLQLECDNCPSVIVCELPQPEEHIGTRKK